MLPEEHIRLGMTAHRAGRLDDARTHYQMALLGDANNFFAARMLGAVCLQRQEFGAAEAALAKANRINPRDASSQQNHAAALLTLKRFNESLAASDRAIALDEKNIPALHIKACALMELARYAEAISVCEQALEIDQSYAEGWYMRANALYQTGRHGDALASYDRVIALQPNRFEALYYRAAALAYLKRPQEALAAITLAIASNPQSAEAYRERGDALRALNRLDEALASYDRALAIEPGSAGTLNSRGCLLLMLGQYGDGLAHFDRAIDLDASNAEAFRSRAQVYRLQGRLEDALQDLRHAFELAPENALVNADFGHVLRDLGRHREALTCFQKATALDPHGEGIAGALLHAKLSLCDWRGLESECNNFRTRIANGECAGTPFELMAIASTPAEQFAAAWNHTREIPSGLVRYHAPRKPREKIRLGYLSTDFRTHAMGLLTIGIFEHHDRSRFETFGISLGLNDRSPLRARMESVFDHFIDARDMTDDQIAEMIAAHEVDILVDLNGFTEGARTGILARRAAPVQVNYLGYPGTMGVDFMDYLIADRILVPAEEEKFYSEKIVVMPHTYQPGSARTVADDIPTRSAYGLPERGFVFCSFNNTFKITPDVFAIWMRILKAVDGSVLWLLGPTPEARQNLMAEAAQAGIDPDRLVFAPRVAMEEHMARHQLADLFLDTLHYTAHTTASDALWNGLPLITVRGRSFAARVPTSLLNAMNLPELVCPSEQAYEALAIELARDPERLAAIRRRVEDNRHQTALFDIERFTRDLEQAYHAMWQRFQSGRAPQTFSVDGDL